jgi:anti-sigma factor RsiW
MTSPCEKVQAFADGELSHKEATPFRRHFVACVRCQSELAEVMLLEALGQRLRPRPTPVMGLPVLESSGPGAPSSARRDSSRRAALCLGGAVVLAAGVVLLNRVRSRRGQMVQSVEATGAP